jgi:hypothetical protein
MSPVFELVFKAQETHAVVKGNFNGLPQGK